MGWGVPSPWKKPVAKPVAKPVVQPWQKWGGGTTAAPRTPPKPYVPPPKRHPLIETFPNVRTQQAN